MLSEKDFHIVSSFVKKKFGILLDDPRNKNVSHILNQLILGNKGITLQTLIKKFERDELSAEQEKKLVEELTIGETYFFREEKALEFLIEKILPELILKKDRIRIWSAACSSGEEPYSIAILLKEKFNSDLNKKFEIWGTDINNSFIAKAKRGEYREWSFRNCPPEIKNKYFVRTGKGTYLLSPQIKNAVNFKVLNLVEENFPQPFNIPDYFDVVLLRNVLIYFPVEVIKRVLDKFYSLITPKGFLITGVTEIAFQSNKNFSPVYFDGIKVFQKAKPKKTNLREKEESTVNFTSGSNKKSKVKREERQSYSKKEFHGRVKLQRKITGAPEKLPKAKQYSFEEINKLFLAREYEKLLESITPLIEKVNNGDLITEENFKILKLGCKSFTSLGMIDNAIELCDKIIESYKLDEEIYYLLSVLLNEKGKVREALENLNRALFLNPNFAMANFLKANLLFKLNKIESARKELKNTLNILAANDDNIILEETDGLTVGSLKKIITSMLGT